MSRIVTIRDELERQIEAARRRWAALQADADAAREDLERLEGRLEQMPEDDACA